MDSTDLELQELLRRASECGLRLLDLLQGPVAELPHDEIDTILEQRGRLIQQVQALRSDRLLGPEAHAELEQLLEQQRVLESQMGATLTSMATRLTQHNAAHTSLRDLERLLRPGNRSRYVDRKR